MGSNSLQGWAVLVLLLAFTCLSMALFQGGSVVFLLLAVVTMAGAIALFLKAKPLEDQAVR
jgi:hypothetical protein